MYSVKLLCCIHIIYLFLSRLDVIGFSPSGGRIVVYCQILLHGKAGYCNKLQVKSSFDEVAYHALIRFNQDL